MRSNVRVQESRTGLDIAVVGNEAVVAEFIFTLHHEASPYGIVGHTILDTRFLAVGGLIPLGIAHDELHRSIAHQVIKPDERVMYLTAIRLQFDMAVIESEGGVDDDYIVRHGSEVVLCSFLRQRIGLRINRVTGIGMEERVDDKARAAAMVDTHGVGTTGNGIRLTRTVIHEYTVGYRQLGQRHFLAVYECGVRTKRHFHIRLIVRTTHRRTIPPLPAIIDSRTAVPALHTTGANRIVAGDIFLRIGVDEGDTIEGDRDNDAVARSIFSPPVRLCHLAGHILDNEELVELALLAGLRHLNHRRVANRVTRRILHIKAVTAEEVEAIHTIVRICHRAIRQQRLGTIGGYKEGKTVIQYIHRHDRAILVAQEADILIVVVSGRHQHIDSHLEVGSRRFPGQSVLAVHILRLGCHPHRINILTFDIEGHVLVFVHTDVDIHIL